MVTTCATAADPRFFASWPGHSALRVDARLIPPPCPSVDTVHPARPERKETKWVDHEAAPEMAGIRRDRGTDSVRYTGGRNRLAPAGALEAHHGNELATMECRPARDPPRPRALPDAAGDHRRAHLRRRAGGPVPDPGLRVGGAAPPVGRESGGPDRTPGADAPRHAGGGASGGDAPVGLGRPPVVVSRPGRAGERCVARELRAHLPGAGHPRVGPSQSRGRAATLLDHARPLPRRRVERRQAGPEPGRGRQDRRPLPGPDGRPAAGAPSASPSRQRAQAPRQVAEGLRSRQRNRPRAPPHLGRGRAARPPRRWRSSAARRLGCPRASASRCRTCPWTERSSSTEATSATPRETASRRSACAG